MKESLIYLLLFSWLTTASYQAMARVPHTKKLMSNLMYYERLNFEQLLARDPNPSNNILLRGLDGLAEITPQHIEYALDVTRSLVSARLGAIANNKDIGFDTLYNYLEEIDVYIEKIWNPIALAAYLDGTEDKKLQQAYTDANSNYLHWIKQQVLRDKTVFRKLLTFKESEELTAEQRRAVEIKLQQMQSAGIELSENKMDLLYLLNKTSIDKTKDMQAVFTNASKNVMLILSDKEDVAGLPEHLLKQAASYYTVMAQGEQASAEEGPWLIGIKNYDLFMEHSTRRELRERLYHSLITMTEGGQYDKLVREILRLKKQLAKIFGYENYTDYIMSTRTIKDSNKIEEIMSELHQATYPLIKQGYESLTAYAQANGHEGELKPYDIEFWKNKLSTEQVGKINPELLEPNTYLVSIEDTMQGAFSLAHKLFGIKIERHTEQKTWHPDVSLYFVYNESGEHIGSFYLDPYRRSGKKHSGWVKHINARGTCAIAENVPVCYMATSFKPPEENTRILLNLNEIRVFMHEFGHVLHYVLMQNSHHTLAHVDRDMIEFASKFMEAFMGLVAMTSDGFPQPLVDLIKKIEDSLNADETLPLSAINVDRKTLEDLFLIKADLELHRNYDPDGKERPADFLRRIANEIRILPANSEDEFSVELLKIMALHPYTNPYVYIYKLGEIIASDVAAFFKENGSEDEQLRKTGQLLWDKFFAAGNSKSTLELFKELRGRPLSIEPYLQKLDKRKLLVD